MGPEGIRFNLYFILLRKIELSVTKSIIYGFQVAAVVVIHKNAEKIVLQDLREFVKLYLPEYAVPTVLRVVDQIPKNNMGKVNKPNLISTIFSEGRQ